MPRKKLEFDIKEVEVLSGRGLTNIEICQALGICQSTLYSRRRESEEFAAALERGKAKAHIVIANALFESAKDGNVTAAIWLEKSRWGMSDDGELIKRIEHLEKLIESQAKPD